jgi:FixJ family two-component response regulator
MSEGATVHVIDDDADMRDSLAYLLRSTHFATRIYSSAREFLDDYHPTQPGCLVCDVRMPDMSGLELVEHLSRAAYRIPVICMTAFADVPMAVRAMKAGAREFVEKPFTAQTILDAIRRALLTDEEQRAATANWEDLRQRMAELTDKERESLAMILEGAPNKVIAARLSITERAVEMRRASLMKKLHAGSFAELVRIATQYELVAETLRRDPA